MKLIDLEPEFMAISDLSHYHRVEQLQDAQGILFLCPLCYTKNNGSVGTHRILCWTPSVPQTIRPVPGRWHMIGNSFEDLSLVAGSSSVLITEGCKAHFYVQQGQIVMCG